MAPLNKKLKIGIIGCGKIAIAHIDNYLQMPDCEIVAAADLIPEKAEKLLKNRFGLENIRYYSSDKELINNEKDLDAVSICTYNTQHASPAIYALNHGLNVLLEKPMCVTMDEAIEISRAEKLSGKILSHGFQPRFDNNMKLLKEIIDSGVLGKIYYIQTGGGRRDGIPTPFGTSYIEKKTAGIGALADIGCYSLDMVLNAIGYPKPLTVTGYKSAFFGTNPKYMPCKEYAEKFEVDDFAAAFIRLENDIILDFRISWAMNMDTTGDTIILGTDGGLRLPSTECWNGSIGGPMVLYQTINGEKTEKQIPLRENEKGNFYYKIRTFLDAIKNNSQSPVPTSQIIINQAIINAIVESSELGKEVTVEIPKI
ncbi:MAG: Gfo/Idh/MocA family oxidoreductase [Clostridiales bacterium]|nr:Gfo/Idh/MocA family oxidoreductase [Clostridiales bacterium]